MIRKTFHHSFLMLLIFIAAGWVSFESCHTKSKSPPASSVIQGFLTDGIQQKIILQELDITGLYPVDSIITGKDGSFMFALFITEPIFYQLKVGESDPLILILNPGEKIQIRGKADSLIFAQIHGSDESRLLQEYLIYTYKNLSLSESLAELLVQKSKDKDFLSIRDSIIRQFDSIYAEQKQFVKHFVQSNPSSLASLIVINQRFGRREVIDEHGDNYLFVKLDSGLIAQYPKSKHTLNFHKQMAEKAREKEIKRMVRENLEPGQEFPYFRLPSLDRNQWISSSDFRGKKLVVAFWVPAQKKSIQQLTRLRDYLSVSSYKDLSVLAVAFDIYSNRWANAIKLANMTHWNHVCDLKGDASPLIELFDLNIDSLPVFYLVDEKQFIMGKYKSADEFLLSLKK